MYKYNIKKEFSVINSRNSKCFFNYVNKKLHSCSTSGPLINADGTKCIDDSKKRNILNDFFASVFTNDNGNMPTLPKEIVNTSGHIIFTPFVDFCAIQKIKLSGSAGPDGLPALFWKKAAAGVAFPLSIIFNNSCIYIYLYFAPKGSTINREKKKNQQMHIKKTQYLNATLQ